MLFTYQYAESAFANLHQSITHLVKEVWCKAEGDFDEANLDPLLYQLLVAIDSDDRIRSDPLGGPIRSIYRLCLQLTEEERLRLSQWFEDNNEIEALCNNANAPIPHTYSDIEAIREDLATELKKFFSNLFTDLVKLRVVRSIIGADLDDQYNALMEVNTESKCPYCGYNDIKGNNNSRREAFDHFLPKNKYPFNSVNLKNLAPMCHECNSSYKLQKDPNFLRDPLTKGAADERRKSFFTYADQSPNISLRVTLQNYEPLNPAPQQIIVEAESENKDEEVATWVELFGIEERYKAKLCAKNDGIAWLQTLVEEANYLDQEQALTKLIRVAEARPFQDANFLKVPFLRACKDAGLICRT